MKKKIGLFLLLAILLAGCAPQVASFVVLPDPLKAAITALITFVVGWVFTQIAKAVPWLAGFLGQYVDETSIALAGGVVLAIQNFLNTIPAQYDDIVSIILQLVIAVLASIGLFKVLQKAKAPGFR
jgi:hypothetical protein